MWPKKITTNKEGHWQAKSLRLFCWTKLMIVGIFCWTNVEKHGDEENKSIVYQLFCWNQCMQSKKCLYLPLSFLSDLLIMLTWRTLSIDLYSNYFINVVKTEIFIRVWRKERYLVMISKWNAKKEKENKLKKRCGGESQISHPLSQASAQVRTLHYFT